MYRREPIRLTEEKFQEIYQNEHFRNQVAYAHGVVNSNMSHKYWKTCGYPIEYIVSDEQKELALKELNRAKDEKIANLGNKLVFCGMGITYEGDDIGNYRIRTYFLNNEGYKFFIEITHVSKGNLGHIDHAIFFEQVIFDGFIKEIQVNNFNNLESVDKRVVFYSKESILKLINREFNCNFTEMEVDNYTLNPDEFVCLSPRKVKNV